MRKGPTSVGAVVVGHRWVLRWEEAVNGTPAAVWLDGWKSERATPVISWLLWPGELGKKWLWEQKSQSSRSGQGVLVLSFARRRQPHSFFFKRPVSGQGRKEDQAMLKRKNSKSKQAF